MGVISGLATGLTLATACFYILIDDLHEKTLLEKDGSLGYIAYVCLMAVGSALEFGSLTVQLRTIDLIIDSEGIDKYTEKVTYLIMCLTRLFGMVFLKLF